MAPDSPWKFPMQITRSELPPSFVAAPPSSLISIRAKYRRSFHSCPFRTVKFFSRSCESRDEERFDAERFSKERILFAVARCTIYNRYGVILARKLGNLVVGFSRVVGTRWRIGRFLIQEPVNGRDRARRFARFKNIHDFPRENVCT